MLNSSLNAIQGSIAYLLGAVALDRAAVERPEDMKLNREESILSMYV